MMLNVMIMMLIAICKKQKYHGSVSYMSIKVSDFKSLCLFNGNPQANLKFATSALAAQIDSHLVSLGNTIPTLVECVAISVAQVVWRQYPVGEYGAVVVCCGCGNNGLDGYVNIVLLSAKREHVFLGL